MEKKPEPHMAQAIMLLSNRWKATVRRETEASADDTKALTGPSVLAHASNSPNIPTTQETPVGHRAINAAEPAARPSRTQSRAIPTHHT